MPKYSRVEKRLSRDIEELEKILMFRSRLDKMKFTSDWQKSDLLCHDRNELIRLGIIKECLGIEIFMDEIITNYFAYDKTLKAPYRSKKYKVFESHILDRMNFSSKMIVLKKILKISPDNIAFLNGLRSLRNLMAHKLFPGLEKRDKQPVYKGKSIGDIRVFKEFIKDSRKCSDYLVDQMIYSYRTRAHRAA